jgi:hypothetical protein
VLRRSSGAEVASVRRATLYDVGDSSTAGTELVLEAVGEDLELHRARPPPGSGAASPRSTSAQHLHDALLVELRQPRRNCLKRPPSTGRATDELLGAKLGIAGKRTGSASYSVSPMPEAGGVDEADDVTGERLLDRLPVGAEDRWRRTSWRTACPTRRG